MLDGENILTGKEDVSLIRAKVGMVFQKPTPFPMSIYDNIAFGVRLFETLPRAEMDERVEWALKKAAMWNEGQGQARPVRHGPAVGRAAAAAVHRARHRDQARGAAARRTVLGARPDLDRQIEELITELKSDYTVVIVTHNMQQAARAARTTRPTCTSAT